jgi:uncharacterized BrkB/YihY/UPF0761 family membrane protein
LLWIYYSSMILLLGAEFTHRYALSKGYSPVPEPGAVKAPAPWKEPQVQT